jgi:hypothetical protein
MDGIDLYFLGGISAVNNRILDVETITWTGTPPSGVGSHFPISAAVIHLGVVGGAGISLPLTGHISAFAEARYHHYFNTAYGFSNGAVGVEPFSEASVSTGLDWHF